MNRRSGNSGLLRGLGRDVRRDWQLYLFLAPAILIVLFFKYVPIYGLQIAFRDFKPTRGIWDSAWVGMKWFERFFQSPNLWVYVRNTLVLSVLGVLIAFPLKILLALILNEIRMPRYKKFVQTVTYAPYFISITVLVSMVNLMLQKDTGVLTQFFEGFGIPAGDWLTSVKAFPWLYVVSGMWQQTGWGAVIFLAALAGVDPQLHEAAMIDGATRLQRIWHVNLPSILPTITIMLILQMGTLMSVGHDKALLMQNALNLEASELISTYVYKIGLQKAQYSLSAAVGMVNSLVNVALMLTMNWIVKKMGQVTAV
ncbi:MAG TPA: sugar ABC transporter permease [Candidatus Faecivicinus avistercoris]|nr:sugar ABC transporter permease [Candidatus Faecivicinus avistercoris]